MTRDVARCVIRSESGEVLLLRRVRGENVQWEMPGGKVEQGESPAQAAAGEVAEELGVSVEIGEKIGQAEFVFDGQNWLYHWFKAKIISGEPQIMEPSKFDVMQYFSTQQMKNDLEQMSSNLRNYLSFLDQK